MKRQAIIVLDLGASGGRMFAAVRKDDRLFLEEVHRFAHAPHYFWQTSLDGQGWVRRHCWDFGRLYGGMLEGLSLVAQRDDLEPVSFGIDTWGSDGVWIGPEGDMLGLLATGRDERWSVAAGEIAARVGGRRLFDLTAVRSDPFCVLNQVYWYARHYPELVQAAATYMPLHSLLNYYLCGKRAAEYTWLSTTGLVRPGRAAYLQEVLDQLQLPLQKMPPLVMPGTILGHSHPQLTASLGLQRQLAIIAPAVHDTASAYLAAPIVPQQKAILISSGTWYLLGIPVGEPLTDDQVYQARLTNIGGCSEVFFQGILMGSWPAQELRRQWSAQDGRELTWDEFGRLADAGPALRTILNIDDELLRAPLNMEQAIQEFCRRTGQPVPADRSQMARAVYEGMALKTALTCEQMQALVGSSMDEILVVGGGVQNERVNQWVADASGLPVRTGPVHAAAIGNAIVQARALGWVTSLEEGRAVTAGAESGRVYWPQPTLDWESAKARMKAWLLT